jgi:hypothetical protein
MVSAVFLLLNITSVVAFIRLSVLKQATEAKPFTTKYTGMGKSRETVAGTERFTWCRVKKNSGYCFDSVCLSYNCCQV